VRKNKNIKKKPFPNGTIGWFDIVMLGGPIQAGSHGRVLEIYQREAKWSIPTWRQNDVIEEYIEEAKGSEQ